jgi:flagellar hook assembly protein FlgD
MAFSLHEAGNVTVSVFDVGGRLTRRDPLGHLASGTHQWTWDGRDDSGRGVASGIYYVRLAAGGEQRMQKLVKTGR